MFERVVWNFWTLDFIPRFSSVLFISGDQFSSLAEFAAAGLALVNGSEKL